MITINKYKTTRYTSLWLLLVLNTLYFHGVYVVFMWFTKHKPFAIILYIKRLDGLMEL